MKKYNLYLSEQQINSLNLLSEQKGLSVSEIIRRALDEFIDKESNKNHLTEKSKEIIE